ncbi:MAG: TolC family protein [Desulfobacterales bacterium]|nr:TolC family protein [Desulfobacterales bacterium]MDH3826382.1 TolC family protein [Desulfobacterales bacterium]MDH3876211.1 TolC family protein [Desulfobacterales bacterium]MDH4009267.1 TolC family protein [Desulfobacterales bacterium]
MKYKRRRIGLFFCLVFFAAGCAQVPKEAGFNEVKDLVEQRVDYRLHWNQETEADHEVEKAIEELLKNELTADAAVQIALLNNPNLQAVYEDLGITQADVVEAGLLENPVIFGQVRFPNRSEESNNYEFGITQNFLNILMQPARKKLSAIRFEQVKLQVADEVIQLVAEVRRTYYSALGARQVRDLRSEITSAARSSFELALRLHSAGNISALELARENAHFEQSRLELANSETALLDEREQLTRLMGFWGPQTNWQLPEQLPDIPISEISLERLESMAIESRLDLAAEKKAVEALAQALGITIDWRWIGHIEVGISRERETDRTWVTGPALAIELPIFNQRQADIARLEAQLRRSQNRLTAQAIDIRSEVRSLKNRLIMQRNLIDHYRRTVLPLREQIVDLTLKKYNYMLTGAFDLLMAKQQEFEAYQKYLETVRDYWIIRAEMQRSLGGRLPGHLQSRHNIRSSTTSENKLN